jgi:hypothetical protein
MLSVDDQPASGVTAPWFLALAWPPGTVFLACLSQADTYTGLLERPLSATRLTWMLLALFLAWALLVPVAGVAISMRRRRFAPALVHVVELIAAVGLSGVVISALEL